MKKSKVERGKMVVNGKNEKAVCKANVLQTAKKKLKLLQNNYKTN